ncbi:MAG TPA: hypothetical protein VK211_07720, partial [Kamptonema sp.]|nr:hypothetical protein [Kamptonema sp.]
DQQGKWLTLISNLFKFINQQKSWQSLDIFMAHSQNLAQLNFENETALGWLGHGFSTINTA